MNLVFLLQPDLNDDDDDDDDDDGDIDKCTHMSNDNDESSEECMYCWVMMCDIRIEGNGIIIFQPR